MTNKIITTLSSSIGSIQFNLFDFCNGTPKFDEVLTGRFQKTETPLNVNKNLNLLVNNHFEYVDPVCPNCESKHVIKQEYRTMNPILGEFGRQTIYLGRYKCKSCGKKFVNEPIFSYKTS